MKIQPTGTLPLGTKVRVSGKLGEVVSVSTERDQCGWPISVHTCRFVSRFHHCTAGQPVFKPIEPPLVQRVNYAFIEVV